MIAISRVLRSSFARPAFATAGGAPAQAKRTIDKTSDPRSTTHLRAGATAPAARTLVRHRLRRRPDSSPLDHPAAVPSFPVGLSPRDAPAMGRAWMVAAGIAAAWTLAPSARAQVQVTID